MFDTEKFIFAVKSRPMLYNVKAEGYTCKDTKLRKWQEVGAFMFNDWTTLSENNKETKLREMNRKWKSIRDHFVKGLKHAKSGKGKQKRKYIYHDYLKFLVPVVEGRKTSGMEVETLLMDVSNDPEDGVDPEFLGVDQPAINIEIDVDEPEEEGPVGGVVYEDEAFGTNGSVTNLTESASDCLVPNDVQGSATLRLVQQDEESDLPCETELIPDDLQDQMGNEAFLMSLLPLLNKLPFESVMAIRIDIMQSIQRYVSNPTTDE